jgi:hypothetical protein
MPKSPFREAFARACRPPTRYDFLRSISLPIHEKSSRGVRCPRPESPVPLPTTGTVANGSVGAGGETIQGLICRPVVP